MKAFLFLLHPSKKNEPNHRCAREIKRREAKGAHHVERPVQWRQERRRCDGLSESVDGGVDSESEREQHGAGAEGGERPETREVGQQGEEQAWAEGDEKGHPGG